MIKYKQTEKLSCIAQSQDNHSHFIDIKNENHLSLNKKGSPIIKESLSLDYQDSNLEKQDQNLLCYHYTIVQSTFYIRQHLVPLSLGYQDSNLEKQDQNLLCYHYTIAQLSVFRLQR